MERDFLGLSSKDAIVVVKEEAVEGCRDSVSGVPWPISSKVSLSPHFMSFKAAKDEKPSKSVLETLPFGNMSLHSGDAFDSNQKHHVGQLQSFAPAALKQQLLGGIPRSAPPSIIAQPGSLAGMTEPWFNTKAPGTAPQLTIFYGGTVNVFDDISPERAQAIMLLAGTGYITSSLTQSRVQVQAAASKVAGGNGAFVNQVMNTIAGSGLSSPMSVSSHPIDQPGSGPANNDEVKSSIGAGIASPVIKKETSNVMASLGSVAATTIMPAAVPQFRKASLARFLEKRKERVLNSSPYSSGRKPSEYATSESAGGCFSATSGAGYGCLSTNKENVLDV